jgi:hypothetical protein
MPNRKTIGLAVVILNCMRIPGALANDQRRNGLRKRTHQHRLENPSGDARQSTSRQRVPEVFNLAQRREVSREQTLAGWMALATEDFLAAPKKSLELAQTPLRVLPDINLHARITMKCTSRCGFCIERLGTKQAEASDATYVEQLDRISQGATRTRLATHRLDHRG